MALIRLRCKAHGDRAEGRGKGCSCDDKRYVVGWREPGGRSRYKTVERQRDAVALKREVERKLDLGEYVEKEQRQETLGEYAGRKFPKWNLQPSTRHAAQQALDRVVLPNFGSVPVGQLTTRLIEDTMDRVEKKGPRPRARRVLSKLLTQLVEEGILPKNPMPEAPPSKKRRKYKVTEGDILTVAPMVPKRYGPVPYLAAYGGFRQGEIFALRVDDINLAEGTLTVDEGVAMTSKPYISTPKNRGSIRTVSIDDANMRMLTDYMKEFPPRDDGLIFFTSTGGLMNSTQWGTTIWRNALKRAGYLEKMPFGFHYLRHFHVAYLLQLGADIKSIQARVGHIRITTTLDLYAYLFEGRDRQLADLIGKARAETAEKLVSLAR